ncbi:hypothetical protein [Kaistia algarum]|uniref:hypothetical protein n=1 Tax=Kaistia algarum TaxID=2083279 RepID=UPI001056F086|nr:hypothetical protein [Kaistia algarum]MCX5511945.1 hypothetical protein [Kaistia algarum]
MASSMTREQADAKFEKTQRAAREAAKAASDYEAENRAMRDRTAKLRELRMARDVAEESAAAEKKAAAKAAPKPARKRVAAKA